MPEETNGPIVIFDGVCGMCNRFVEFALWHDQRGELVFTPSQSPFGAALCERLQCELESSRTIIVVNGQRLLTRSDAVVHIATHLKPPYCYLAWIRFMPKIIRDLGYRFVASVRRIIPANHKACELLPPELQKRIREEL